MPKFEVLQISAVLKQRIGIYSWHLTHPTHNFFKSKSTYWVLFFLTSGFITSSALYVMKNSTQLAVQLQTTIVVIAGFQCTGMLLGVGCNMKKVRALHYKLQEIVDKGENNSSLNNIKQQTKSYSRSVSQIS